MPPFGKHGALTRNEINKIIDYLYTLWGEIWTEETL
jgi:mono/diheme cytochrome c family protein